MKGAYNMNSKEDGKRPIPKWPEGSDHELIHSYMNTTKLHRALIEKQVNKTGVFRSQHQLLMGIFNHPGISQKELADFHNVSTAAVAVSLKKLEKGGYVERPVDVDDNRFHKVRLTEKGKMVAEESREIFGEIESGMFSGFSDEEKKILSSYIGRINQNLKTMLQKTEKEGE
jgi:DNA-binding MarR family transcriptional regulator